MSEILRPYQHSHPFVNFTFDLSKLDLRSWLLLGEANSNCQHLAGVPLKPDVATDLHLLYLAKGALATTAIEGNTMTEEEAMARVREHRSLPPSREYHGIAIDNIVDACNAILDDARRGRFDPLSPDRIKQWNALVLRNLEVQRGVVPGKVRRDSVAVGGYKAVPAGDCEYLLKELCDWLNGPKFSTDRPELRFTVAVLQAIVAHIYIAWIHPFGDGNGRTARLVEFEILVRSGFPSPAGHMLSNHYNLTRDHYYLRLAEASLAQDGMYAFVLYALEGLVDGLREQVGRVRDHIMEVTWDNYVHESFRGMDTGAERRRRELVLCMSATDPATAREVPVLSPHLALLYAGKQPKTVTRDLNELLKRNLIRRERGGYISNRDVVKAFLPVRAEPD